ncbi:Leucine-rich repeat receptor-like protein kinase PXC1 [Striga hermonthica]|uniref:Leucine-rich repeat receptor-like protein kinase PXC1 n=1 Tax=Striga hermonthica TaxID=68872 RepID=A0A9N7NJR3_STRHE|nr:Leucine-rich repeat receptor-like protein kinase PXC1 [Striga hermonthica]
MDFKSLLPSLLLISTLFLITSPLAADDSDTAALTQFRSQADIHGILLLNWTAAASDACSAGWTGVNCTNGRVTAVVLPSHNLRGPIDALASLDQLRLLDLRGNRLNGTLSPLARCLNLKLIYLSGNDFSGQIPPEISALHRLLRLDLSTNNLRGPIPPQLANLTRLITLHLQNNEISGPIPNFLSSPAPNLTDLNLSNNELYGFLPDGLISRYGSRSFAGNQALCGEIPPFPNCTNSRGQPSLTVPSSPSSLPPSQTVSATNSPENHRKKLGSGAIVAIAVANSVLLLVIASFTVAYCCGKSSRSTNSMTTASEVGKRSSYSSEKKVYVNNNNNGGGDSDGTNATDRSKLVFFDRKKQFELEDLLRASAEMLGKGSLGTVYKAVLDDGCTVAVKRLKDANPCARKEFEQYMDVIGKLKHPNVVRFRAYYYAKEEKLLVYDYMPNGSLHSLLHANRGPGRIPLDWTTRIGLVETKRLSQKADVYAFGVVLLEVLTGRAPSEWCPSPGKNRARGEDVDTAGDLPGWVRSVVRDEWTAEVFDQELLRYKNIEEELVSTLHVGMACVVPQPEKRPTMGEVVRMIEEIRVEQSPLGEDYDESRNSMSPSVATTTEDAF